VMGDASAVVSVDAGDNTTHDAISDGQGGDDLADAGSSDVFTSPILFELFAPKTTTYGVQHIVVDSAAFSEFLDSHRGETLRLRFGAVSSSFPVMGAFDNVALHVGP
jgi:hypothetical protein